MRFLVDAQLPRRLASFLQHAGHEATHTLDLPEGNRTPDEVIEEVSRRERAVLIPRTGASCMGWLGGEGHIN